MGSTGHAGPVDIVDTLLWKNAQVMLERHEAPDTNGDCLWCRRPWPCQARLLAERAAQAARRPAPRQWETTILPVVRPTPPIPQARDESAYRGYVDAWAYDEDEDRPGSGDGPTRSGPDRYQAARSTPNRGLFA